MQLAIVEFTYFYNLVFVAECLGALFESQLIDHTGFGGPYTVNTHILWHGHQLKLIHILVGVSHFGGLRG